MHRFPIVALLLSATSACQTHDGITFEIYAASAEHFSGAVSRVGTDSKVIYTMQIPAITLDEISSAEVMDDPYLGRPSLVLRMTPSGARKLEEVSKKQLNSMLAFVLDGKVISSGFVRTVMTDQLMLTPVVRDADTARLVERINKRAN